MQLYKVGGILSLHACSFHCLSVEQTSGHPRYKSHFMLFKMLPQLIRSEGRIGKAAVFCARALKLVWLTQKV